MPHILLVNPSKRKPRRKTSTRKNPVKKRRSAKQKAATRKLVAFNRRRKNPVTARRRRSTTKKTKRRTPSRRTYATKRRSSRRRRRNPALSMRSVQNQVMDAGTGAVGAIALDVVQGYLPIPANLKAGIVGTLVKVGLAISIGIIGSKVRIVSNAVAGKMANGALTVVLHDELKKQIMTFAPGIQMGEYLGPDGLGMYEGAGYAPYGEDTLGGPYLPSLDTESLDFQQDGFGMGEYVGAPGEYMDEMDFA